MTFYTSHGGAGRNHVGVGRSCPFENGPTFFGHMGQDKPRKICFVT